MDQRAEEICFEVGCLTDKKSRRNLLGRFPELVSNETVAQLAEAVRSAVRVDVRKAMSLAEAALTVARELRRPEALALGLRAKANALWFMGDCKQAVRLFRHAASLFELAGNSNEVARTLSSSIQSLSLIGEYEKAFAAAKKARAIFTDLGENWRVARVDINLANIFHRQNRYAEALSTYERAYQQLLPHRDMEGIGVALHNMAVCLIALDDFERALETYERVRDFCMTHEMPLLVAQANYNVAHLSYLRGDYTEALDLLRSTRETYKRNGDHYHVSLCDLDQSEIYLELGLVEEAADMAQDSLQQFEELGMNFESARALINLAIAVSLKGDARRSLELFGRAKIITQGENNQVWPNLIDLYRALVLFESGDFGEAGVLAQSSAKFFEGMALPSKHVLCLLLMTRVSLRIGNVSDAASQCLQALAVLEHLDSPILFYQAQFLRGQAYESEGEPEAAYGCYQASRSALEALRSSLQRHELKLGFMSNRLEVYTRLVQLCLNRDAGEAGAEEALSYIEAAKSRTLRDLILEGAQPGRGLSEEIEVNPHVRNLRKELNWYYHRIEREQLSQDSVSKENVLTLRQEAQAREHELLRRLLEVPATGPVGAALRNSNTATLKQIRLALGEQTALLEYFTLGEQVFVAVVTARTIQVVPLAPLSQITQRLRMVQFQLSKFRLDGDYVSRFAPVLQRTIDSHLRGLYDDLIAPLTGLLNVRDLVIVPFGPLHSLPFHALFDGHNYLVEKFTVCYEPSASIFAQSHGQERPRGGSSLVLGIDDPKLPFIKNEVEAVAASVPEPLVLFGADATEAALRDYGTRSRLIHIASHGIFRQDSPMFSSIRLADSFLTLYDLYHMNLPVDLLTLSGCVSGLNVVAGGDELLGLTRGLLYAGTQSLLLSLWDVEDRSTSEFMKEFYSQLRQQPRKADAFRSASLLLRERYPHPYYWAPFKLIGRAL